MSLRGGSRRDNIPFEDRDHPTVQYFETLVDKNGNPVHIPPPTNQSTTPQHAPAAGSSAPPTSIPSPSPQNLQQDDRGAQETQGSNLGSIFNNPTGVGREPPRGHIPPLDIPGPETFLNPVQPRPNDREENTEADEYEMTENPGEVPKSKAAEPTVRGVGDPNANDQDDEITEAPPLEPEENPPLPSPAPTGSQSGGAGASNTQDQGQGDTPGHIENTTGGNITGGNDPSGNDAGGNNPSGNPTGGDNPGGNNTQRPTWWARHKARREVRRQFRANATPANNHSTPLSRCWEGCFCTPLCWCAGLICGPIQWLVHNWCSPT